MEDEGTPPAEHEGFLSGQVSPSYHSQPWQSIGWQERTMRPRELGVKRGTKQRRPAGNSEAVAVDLITLLEENWFWRSSTASPSMALEGGVYTSEALPTPVQRARRGRSPPVHDPAAVQDRQLGAVTSSEPEREAVASIQSTERVQEGNAGESQVDLADNSDPSQIPVKPQASSQSPRVDGFTSARGHQPSIPQSFGSRSSQTSNNRVRGRAEEPELNLDEIDTIGTWGHRMLRFQPGRKASTPTHIPGTPEEPEMRPHSARNRSRSHDKPTTLDRRTSNDDEAAAMNAAWRWRFNRRWRTEQAKQLDPDFGLDVEDEDGWDDALGYLDACGPGVQHQIARTTSLERTLTSSSLLSNGSETSQLFADDSHKDKSALRMQADMDATKKVRSVAKKAQDLYRQQQKIEQDVKARWGSTQFRMSWAGQHLKAVDVDTYGVYRFVLVRVNDRTSAHRLLVRGRNGAGVEELMRELVSEVNSTCKEHHMPLLSIVLIGSGMISWSRGQDRKINFQSGHVEKGKDPSIQTNDDVCRLAGALTRTSMPAPTQVTVNGKKLS